MAKEKRVQELERLVRHHRDLYYNQEPEISDADFDALVDELKKLGPESPILERHWPLTDAPSSAGRT